MFSICGSEMMRVMDSLNQPIGTMLIALDALPDGGCTEVEAWIEGALESLIVYRDGDHARAWLNLCPHAGRRLDWAPGQFLISKAGHLVCAVHGASFSLPDGVCVQGPCRGEALREVAVELRGGSLHLAR